MQFSLPCPIEIASWRQYHSNGNVICYLANALSINVFCFFIIFWKVQWEAGLNPRYGNWNVKEARKVPWGLQARWLNIKALFVLFSKSRTSCYGCELVIGTFLLRGEMFYPPKWVLHFKGVKVNKTFHKTWK